MKNTYLLLQPVTSVVDLVRPPVEVVPRLLVLEAVAAPVVLGAVLESIQLALSKLRLTQGLLYRGAKKSHLPVVRMNWAYQEKPSLI